MPDQPKPGSPATKKQQRESIRLKYDNRCAYCGCELKGNWHVDHIEPIVRNSKFVKGHYIEISTGKKMTTAEINAIPETVAFTELYRWVHDKWVSDGCKHPERETIENYMPACASCNINKHSETVEQFRASIAAYMKHLNEISTQYKIAKRYGLIIETGNPVVFYFETLNTNDHEKQ